MSSAAQPRKTGIMANTAILTGYAAVEIVIVFVFTIVVARFLGTRDFGRLGFALSYALLASVFADPGISLSMTKLVARNEGERQRQLVDAGLAIRLALSAVVFAIAVSPFAFSAPMRSNATVIVAILVSEILRSFALYLCSTFRGHQRNKYEVAAMAVERVGALAAAWFLLRLGFGVDVIALVYLFARSASLLTAIIIYVRRFGPLKIRLHRDAVAEIKREAAPLAVLAACERANMYLPPVLVTVFAGAYATGIFQSAFKAIMPAAVISTAVAASLYAPMASGFSSNPAQSSRLFQAGVRGLLHALLPAAVVTLLLPRQLIVTLYGHEYADAAPVLCVLTAYFVSVAFIALSHLFLPAIDRQRNVAGVSMLSVALNVVLALALVPRWGAMGAAVALASAHVVVALVYLGLAYKYGRAALIVAEWRSIALAFAAALLAVYAARPALSAEPLWALLEGATLGTAAYLLVLLLSGGISPQEREVFRSLTRKLMPRPV